MQFVAVLNIYVGTSYAALFSPRRSNASGNGCNLQLRCNNGGDK